MLPSNYTTFRCFHFHWLPVPLGQPVSVVVKRNTGMLIVNSFTPLCMFFMLHYGFPWFDCDFAQYEKELLDKGK